MAMSQMAMVVLRVADPLLGISSLLQHYHNVRIACRLSTGKSQTPHVEFPLCQDEVRRRALSLMPSSAQVSDLRRPAGKKRVRKGPVELGFPDSAAG